MATPFPRSRASIAFVLGALALSACQQSDLETFDAKSRSGVFITDDSAEGKLEYRVWSMLDGTSKKTAHLRYPNPDGYRDLELEVVLPEGEGELESGTYLRAYGDFDDEGRLVADEIEVQSGPAVPQIDPEWYPLRRLATVIVFWDTPGLPNSEAKSSMFLGNKSTHIFYGENSYGKENMIGEVFGPYQIPDPGGCNVGFIADAGVQAMIDKGHDPGDYTQHMFEFPFLGDCGFGGLATTGSVLQPATDSWYNGSFGCVVRNQEIGHNYGMGHSHAYNCQDENGDPVPLSDNCEHIEYGHPYDPMGGGCGHMNVVQKDYMGWIEDCNILTAPVDGSYNISPTELPCNGTQALKIPAGGGAACSQSGNTNCSYYLEYRQPLGAFDGIPGVLLHYAPTEFGGGPPNYILDVGDNGFMHVGDSFTDPTGSVTIAVTDEQDSHAVIQVTFADGGAGEPSCDGGGVPEMSEGNIGLIECSAEPKKGDVVPPEVEIVYPLDGDYFEPGADFKIMAEASDDRVVADLELYVNGESLFKILEEPWEWDVMNIPEGDYEFGVVARDGVNWTPSNAVTVHVTNDIPPPPGEDETGGADDGSETTGMPMGDTGGDESGDSSGGDGGANVEQPGCGCHSGGRGAPAAALLGVILFGLRRRRRT